MPSALLFLLLALLLSALLVPRPVLPRVLVLPRLDHGELERLDRRERARAREAIRAELAIDVRLVGELFRRAGRAMAEGNPGLSRTHLRDLRKEVLHLRSAGRSHELLLLRALQGELFVRALGSLDDGPDFKSEIVELGGEFEREVRPRFWADDGSGGLSNAEARLLFRLRWGQLTGTHGGEDFGPSLAELRAHYALFLRFPKARSSDPGSRASERARTARALAKIDQDFPGDAAVGFLLAEAGEADSARVHLSRYLETHDGGPFALSARNALFYLGWRR